MVNIPYIIVIASFAYVHFKYQRQRIFVGLEYQQWYRQYAAIQKLYFTLWICSIIPSFFYYYFEALSVIYALFMALHPFVVIFTVIVSLKVHH